MDDLKQYGLTPAEQPRVPARFGYVAPEVLPPEVVAMNRHRELKVVGSRGTVCAGDFVYVTRREGEGVLNCDDGRSGPFEFVSTGMRGTGHGDLAGQRFTFTFGKEK